MKTPASHTSMKRRLVLLTSIIVVVVVGALVLLSVQSASPQTVSVAQACTLSAEGQSLKVEGEVVDNSYTREANTLSFAIRDTAESEAASAAGESSETDASAGQLTIVYTGSTPSTFGNGIIAVCTGKLVAPGVLECSELITKCPSKYEEAATSGENGAAQGSENSSSQSCPQGNGSTQVSMNQTASNKTIETKREA